MKEITKPYSKYLGKWLYNDYLGYTFFLVKIKARDKYKTMYYGFDIDKAGKVDRRDLTYNESTSYPERAVSPTSRKMRLVIRSLFK